MFERNKLLVFLIVLFPSLVIAGSNDFGVMYWDGLERQTRVVIETSRYDLRVDGKNTSITAIVPCSNNTTAKKVVLKPGCAKCEANVASCSFSIEGKHAAVLNNSVSNNYRNDILLVESGNFFQRREWRNLKWKSGKPPVKEPRVELGAWPDRIHWLLKITPSVNMDGSLITAKMTMGKGVKLSEKQGRVTAALADARVVFLPAGKNVKLQAKGQAIVASLDGKHVTPNVESEVGFAIFPQEVGDVELQVTAVQQLPAKKELTVTRDAVRGWYEIELRNDGNRNIQTPEGRDRVEKVTVTVVNPSDCEVPARLNFARNRPHGITGISAILADGSGRPNGMQVQVSKNWHNSPKEAKERYRGPWYRGFAFVIIPAGSKRTLTYYSVAGNWAGVPAISNAQLCLVGWGGNQLWIQAAQGAWGETFCFDPTFTLTPTFSTDQRPFLVKGMKSNQKHAGGKYGWTHNIGGASFLVCYTGKNRNMEYPEHAKMWFDRYCPTVSEATYGGRMLQGAIDYEIGTVLYRTDDLGRCIYHLRARVNRDVSYKRFVIFQMGTDRYHPDNCSKVFAVGNETGLVKKWATKPGGNVNRTQPMALTGRVPWIGLVDGADRGIIVRSWKARLGGVNTPPVIVERGHQGGFKGNASLCDFVPPPGVKGLIKGDFVEAVFEQILFPEKVDVYYGPNETLREALKKDAGTWKLVHRECVSNDLKVKVNRGKLVRLRPLEIQAEEDRAEFTVIGGSGYLPVIISGLKMGKSPILQVDGKDVMQGDGSHPPFQVDYDMACGTYSVCYTVPGDTGDKKRVFVFTRK